MAVSKHKLTASILAQPVLLAVLIYWNKAFELNFNNFFIIFLMWVPLLIINWVLICSRDLTADFKSHLLKTGFTKASLVSILSALVLMFVMTFIRYTPLFFGSSAIEVSTAPYLGKVNWNSGAVLFMLIFPAFHEEFLNRFFTHHIFFPPGASTHRDSSKRDKILKNLAWAGPVIDAASRTFNKYRVPIWVIASSFIFAVVHQPDITNIYGYLLAGIVFAVVFLKLGFIPSVICHVFANYFSPYVHQLVIMVVK